MSAPAAQPKRQNGNPNSELMRALGSTSYTAMPPEQHEWQKAEAEHNPPLHRLWSWMVHNTLTWGHTTIDGEPKAYATSKDGLELHLEHAAKDLGMDPGNVRRAWREGAEMGLWRKGTAAEGKRKLFLCGKVAPPKVAPEDPEPDEKVCTDLFPDYLRRKLPPYVVEQILTRRPDDVKQIASWYSKHIEIERLSLAELMAAGRLITGKLADSAWRQWGIEVRRLNGAGKEDEAEEVAEEVKARQARLASLLPHVEQLVETVSAHVVAPADPAALAAAVAVPDGPTAVPSRVPRSVQTRDDSVQRSESALYKPNFSGVQGGKNGSTLSPVSTTSKSQRAGGHPYSGAGENRGASLSSGGKAAVQVHAGESSTLASATVEERENAVSLLAGIAKLQKKHPAKFAGDEVTALSRADLAVAIKMVRTVGATELNEFLLEIEQRAVDRALGHQLSIALLSEIAGDFARGKSKREKARRDAEDQERKRKAIAEAAARLRQRDDELFERTEQAWDALPVTERMERLKKAAAQLKADPHWSSSYKNATDHQRRDQVEIRAKRTLRTELEGK